MMAASLNNRGTKRKLSGSDDKDNYSSPECLMLSEPARDAYSSDNEKPKKQLHPKLFRIQYHDGTSVKELQKITNASEVPCHVVKYLTHSDFEKRKPEKCLKNSSVDECLHYAFKFATNVDSDEDVKVSGKTAKQTYEDWIQEKEFLWMEQNDKSNFHEFLRSDDYKKEIGKLDNFIKSCDTINANTASKLQKQKNIEYYYAKFVQTLSFLFDEIYSSDESSQSHQVQRDGHSAEYGSVCGHLKTTLAHVKKGKWNNLVKSYLGYAAEVVAQVCCEFKSSGQCTKEFPLIIKKTDIGICSSKQVEDCTIIVNPDAVFSVRAGDELLSDLRPGQSYVWKLLVQVSSGFDNADNQSTPVIQKDSSLSPHAIQSNNERSGSCIDGSNSIDVETERKSASSESITKHNITAQPLVIPPDRHSSILKSPSKEGFAFTARTEHPLSSEKYCKKLREAIEVCVPMKCNTTLCIDQIAGEHVLQLYSMAHQRMQMNEDNTTAVGLFIVNEIVYFSRLIVPEQTMSYITTGSCLVPKLPELLENGTYGRGKVAYGNFHLDLTIANHRRAFIIFLREYIFS